MKKTFQEQIALLKKRLTVVPLSKEDLDENPHLDMLNDFKVRTYLLADGRESVSSLQDYITGYCKYEATYMEYRGDYIPVIESKYCWQAKEDNDADRNRIFLVIDNLTEEVAFYFGLSTGLIADVPASAETKSEETLVETFLGTFRIQNKKQRKELEDELYKAARNLLGAEEAKRLRTIAENELAMQQDRENSREKESEVLLREDTFPAIELTHFVKNMNYKLPDYVEGFSIGEYVFWEIILEKIHKIKEETGLQYMYLFAADPGMNRNPIDEQTLDDRRNSDDITEEEAAKISEKITGKLVSYYRNIFGFRIVEGKQLIKPAYDYNCYSMFAPLQKLDELKVLYCSSQDTTRKRKGKKS